jgi:hypothetical protein
MKIWSVMLGSALAEYKSIEVLNLMTTSPSNGLVETHEPTFRPQELQWLAGLQQLENNDIKFADLNIAKMVIQGTSSKVTDFRSFYNDFEEYTEVLWFKNRDRTKFYLDILQLS